MQLRGAQRSLKRNGHTSYPGNSESSKVTGAKWWGENQRLLLFERAGVWGELSTAEGHRGERLAAKWGV